MRPPRSRCRSKSSSGAGNRVPGPGITSGEQTGKALVSPWRERVDDTSATSSPAKCRVRRPCQGAGILTGYCTLVKGERATSPQAREERKEKGEEGWGFVGRLRQGVCVQDSLGVGNLHRVPARVRGRADQDPVSDDDRRASGPDELGLVGVPRGRRQRREGDRVEQIGSASGRESGENC